MQEKGKHIYTKEELLKLIKEGKNTPSDMDEFDREALDGLKLLENEDVLDKLNEQVDILVQEEGRKKRTLYYFSAAASLLLLIGLVFFLKNSFVNKDGKTIALAEKPKEENLSTTASPLQVETPTTYEEKEPEPKSEVKSKTTEPIKETNQEISRDMVSSAMMREEESKTKHSDVSPDKNTSSVAFQGGSSSGIATDKTTTENKEADNYEPRDIANQSADEAKALSKSNTVSKEKSTLGSEQNKPGEHKNKQDDQSIAANETETNNSFVSNGATHKKEKAEKKTVAGNTSPTQAAGFSQSASAPVNQLAETDAKKQKEPAYIGGDSAFAVYIKQNLKTSSPASSGMLIVSFLVTKDGKAESIEITKPIDNCTACSDDVVNLIRSVKKWQPAVMNGKSINAYKKISIRYNQ